MGTRARGIVVVMAIALMSCGSSARLESSRATTSKPTQAGGGWSTLGWEERHLQMTFLVHPNMARLFQHFQGKAYPDMTCRTCHGADAEQVHYKMPHGLPALDPAHLPDPNARDAKGRTTKFMIEEVTPKMAELLDVEPYEPRTGRGFGCFGCHPAER